MKYKINRKKANKIIKLMHDYLQCKTDCVGYQIKIVEGDDIEITMHKQQYKTSVLADWGYIREWLHEEEGLNWRAQGLLDDIHHELFSVLGATWLVSSKEVTKNENGN